MEADSRFSVYVPTESSPQLFGDVAVIVSAYEDRQRIFGDAFILLERNDRRCVFIGLQVSPLGNPEELPPVDLDFMLVAGRNRATRYINGLLRAERARDEAILMTGFSLRDAGSGHLSRLWIEGVWRTELRQIEPTCPALRAHLDSVRNYRVITSYEPSMRAIEVPSLRAHSAARSSVIRHLSSFQRPVRGSFATQR